MFSSLDAIVNMPDGKVLKRSIPVTDFGVGLLVQGAASYYVDDVEVQYWAFDADLNLEIIPFEA